MSRVFVSEATGAAVYVFSERSLSAARECAASSRAGTRQHTLCLDNQWVLQAADGSIQLRQEEGADAKQIAQAVYIQEPEAVRLWLQFSDGTITEVRATA